MAGYVGIHILKSCLLNIILQRGIDPYFVPSSPRLPPSQPAGHPVVESAPNSSNAVCHDPLLQPLKHDQLNHLQVNMTQGLGIRTLPAQHPSQPRPFLTCSPKVVDPLWLVIFLRRENSPKILEGGDWVEGYPIVCD